MHPFCLSLRSVAALSAAMALLPALPSKAQTFAASVGTVAPAMRLGDATLDRPSVPGHHRNAPERLIYARVRDGVYTVDGMVAKFRLNYDVQGSRFLYMFVPGLGTAVLSVAAQPGAVVVPAALHGGELSFGVAGHALELTGISLESDRGEVPAHLFVSLDRSAWNVSRLPRIGYGNLEQMPYEWPRALPVLPSEAGTDGPPIPSSLLPRTSASSPTAKGPATPALRPVALP